MVKWFCLVSFLFVFSTVQPSTTDKREIIRYSDSVLSSRGFRTPTSKPQPVLHSGWEPCRDKGECFSGAWFGQSQHITFSPDLGDFNSSKRAQLMKRVYCEDASNWFFHKMFRHKAPNYAWGDMPAQSIDVFDFSVFHLSTAERLLQKNPAARPNKWKEVGDIVLRLKEFYNSANSDGIRSIATQSDSCDRNISHITSRLNDTIVIIPFIIKHRGMGNSERMFRDSYLNLTFWSLYPFFKNIVAAVKYVKDEEFARHESGLPFMDVLMIPDIPDCGLPLAAIIEARRLLLSKTWSFKYLYFTEADQIFVARDLPSLYGWMDLNAHGVITPHRLVITPFSFLRAENKSTSDLVMLSMQDVSAASCCMDTGGHGETRVHWKSIRDSAVEIVSILGVPMCLGNANLFSQIYRSCNVTKSRVVDDADPNCSQSQSTKRPRCDLRHHYLNFEFSAMAKHHQN